MKKALKWIAISVGMLAACVAVILGIGVLFWATSKSLPVTQQDKSRIVTAADLEAYFEDLPMAAEYENFEKLAYIDGSVEVTYEYDSPDEEAPYIAVTVTEDKTRRDSNATYTLEWSGQQLGMNVAESGIDIIERSAFFSAGDKSRFGDITFEGETMGHIFVAQKGRTVYAFTIVGVVIDDPVSWQELFEARIQQL